MIVSINQPAYLPWLGYFDRIARSDVHVVLDHAQFEKNSMVNRNKIRTPQGWAWLTVPLLTKGRFGDLAIDGVEINPATPWARKHRAALQANYARTPHFADHAAFFDAVWSRDWPRLAPLLEEITSYLLTCFSIETPIVRSSALALTGRKSDLVLEIVRSLGGTTYVSGPFGRDYLDLGAFKEAGIDVLFHDYVHPTYAQAFDGFEPYMSAVDLLFNHGLEARALLDGGPASLRPY